MHLVQDIECVLYKTQVECCTTFNYDLVQDVVLMVLFAGHVIVYLRTMQLRFYFLSLIIFHQQGFTLDLKNQ